MQNRLQMYEDSLNLMKRNQQLIRGVVHKKISRAISSPTILLMSSQLTVLVIVDHFILSAFSCFSIQTNWNMVTNTGYRTCEVVIVR